MAQDARKLSWKARARSHNSGLDEPLSRAYSGRAKSPESDDAHESGRTAFDPEAGGGAAARASPLRHSTSFERLSAASATKRSLIGTLLLWSCLILAGMVAVSLLSPNRDISQLRQRLTRSVRENSGLAALGVTAPASADTLVVYTYSKSDVEYERNLHFFVKHGMAEGDGCDYVIIVQQGTELFGSSHLPELPRNARYVFHENRCYDWGTFGWAMAERKITTSRYSFVIFMNSSVRGPFLPAYWPAGVHWSGVLTTRISDEVKLVGTTISCEPAWLGADTSNEKRQVPHVQSYVIALDQVGLDVLRRDGRVFECYEDMADTIFHAELGASRAVLTANYTIDSLMLRYQGVDWTNTANWECNAGLNPYAEQSYDGVPLNPLEVMFVKVKGFQLEGDWLSTHLAATYDRWLDAQGVAGAIVSNDYAEHRAGYKLPKALAMQRRGRVCFDHDYYRARSRDLPAWSPAQLWDHFVHDGQFEGRPFRFTCENPLRNEAVAEAVLRASGKDLDPTMAAAAEAAQAAVQQPAEAAARAESAAAVPVAGSLPALSPPQPPGIPGAVQQGAAEALPIGEAEASAAALRRSLTM